MLSLSTWSLISRMRHNMARRMDTPDRRQLNVHCRVIMAMNERNCNNCYAVCASYYLMHVRSWWWHHNCIVFPPHSSCVAGLDTVKLVAPLRACHIYLYFPLFFISRVFIWLWISLFHLLFFFNFSSIYSFILPFIHSLIIFNSLNHFSDLTR